MRFRFKAFGWHLVGSASALDADARPSVSRLVPLARMVSGGHADRARDHGRRRRRPGTAPDLHRCGPREGTPHPGPGRGSHLARAIGGFRLWRHDPLARPAALLRVLRELSLGGSSSRHRARFGRPQSAQNAALAPHWYSLPRWIWAPLPNDSEEADKIVQSAIQGGFDVTARPAYYKPWASGAAELRSQLKRVDEHQVLLAEGAKSC